MAVLAACVLLFSPAAASGQPARPELRAFWADGFNDGYKTPEQVDLLLQRLRQAHCNALFAQVRKSGDAYYQSHYEPWAADDQAHFDALAYLVERAHSLQPPIQVHAWINCCAVGRGANLPRYHVGLLHPDWLSVNPAGDPADTDSRKIDPADPDAADWTFRVYMDVVRHYDVDGIHLDFVRYGGPNMGYSPASLRRFRQQTPDWRRVRKIAGTDLPAPDDPLWRQWRRDQVTALVRKIYVNAIALRPRIVVSAALIAWLDAPKSDADWRDRSAAMTRVFQDWRSWLQEGILDLGCPMTYFQGKLAETRQREWTKFIASHQYGRRSTIGIANWMNPIPETLRLIDIARSTPGPQPYGLLLYSYAGTNAAGKPGPNGKAVELKYQPEFYAALGAPSAFSSAPPFPEDVPAPEMRWKSEPAQGCLSGFVLTSGLSPVDGALVTVSDRDRAISHRTDGTGFYAFTDLPTGKVRVHVRLGRDSARGVAIIAAGAVASLSLTLGKLQETPIESIGAPDGAQPPGAGANGSGTDRPVRLDDVVVTMGTDVLPGQLYAVDRSGAGLRVNLAAPPVLPLQAGDRISVEGRLSRESGLPSLDDAVVRLTGIVRQSSLPAPASTDGLGLAAGSVGVAHLARVQGTVTEAGDDGFTLDARAGVRVLLRGLKDFGVEASGSSLRAPQVGAKVSVTGIVCSAQAGAAQLPVIRPRGPDDVTVLSAPSASAGLWRLALGTGGVAALLLFATHKARPYVHTDARSNGRPSRRRTP
jgi:uncharacterized lipoprotein YddW (UPF0748 family)